MNEKQLEAVRKAGDWEKDHQGLEYRFGWEWRDIGVHPSTISTLLAVDLVVCEYQSHRHKNYFLTERGRSVYDSLVGEKEIEDEPMGELPDNMFASIVGYDDVKVLLRESLQLEKPLHILLVGPPSLAKTMFLWEIEKVGGERAQWAIGSASSHSALWDVLASRRPKWLLLDELEKMDPADQSSLLSLMEGGRLTRLKVGRELDERVIVWVVATANTLKRLSPELLSRFAIKYLKSYDNVTYQRVVKNVLVMHEGMGEDEAAVIATKLIGRTQDVRDAVRVARLSKRVGVSRAVELLLG